jgi:DNA-directed RNA polymerase subunit RPC12/RpoP
MRSLGMVCLECLHRFDLDEVLEDGSELGPEDEVNCPECNSTDVEINY